jgi:hypothetical protein
MGEVSHKGSRPWDATSLTTIVLTLALYIAHIAHAIILRGI